MNAHHKVRSGSKDGNLGSRTQIHWVETRLEFENGVQVNLNK